MEPKGLDYSKVKYPLLRNVHRELTVPSCGSDSETWYTKNDTLYFHYNCDQTADNGWGCGYRTLQSMCAYVLLKQGSDETMVPSINEIQQILVRIGDKTSSFLGSKQWIGVMEASYVIHALYDVSCKILHVSCGIDLNKYLDDFRSYFNKYEGFLMMGGDSDAASKGIAGLHIPSKGNKFHLLVVDPHFARLPKSKDELIEEAFVRWQSSDKFDKSSFYNICMPYI